MDILNILLTVVLLFLFPAGQAFRFYVGNGIAINPLDVGVSVVAISTFCFLLVKKKGISSVYIPLGLFLLAGLVGLGMNAIKLLPSEFLVSSLYLVRFILYASLGITVGLFAKKQKIFMLHILRIGGGIFLLTGFLQYFFFPSLRGFMYAGWDPHLYRMFGTFLDPNFAGVFLGLYLLLILHTFFQQKHLKKKFFVGIVGFFTLLAVALTYSRTTYVMTLISLLIYFSFIGFAYMKYLFFGLVIIVIFILSPFVHKYGEGIHLLRTVSTNARLTDDKNALFIWSQNPIVGVGFDAYRYAQHRYHIINGFNWEDTHSGAGVSNSLLFVLATTGILGGISFGYFWFNVLKKCFNTRKSNPYSIFLFSSFIALLVSSLFENTLFYPSIMVWMWVLVGLIG